VALPDRVMIRPTCEVEVTERNLLLKYAGRQLTLPGPDTIEGHEYAPLAEGRMLATADLVPMVRRQLSRLASRGVLADPDQPGRVDAAQGSCGINTVGCFADENYRLSQEIPNYSDAHMARFLSGDYAPSYIRACFLEQYHFTNSAAWHIAPVLDHDLSSLSRVAWSQFLADEIPHFRIWRPALSSFGWDFAKVRKQIPREQTAWLIESFRGAAAHSQLSYLGLVAKVEAAPLASHYSESDYYTTLLTKYGLPESAVRPLWWHEKENVVAGHNLMPAALMAQLGYVTADRLSDAFWYLRRCFVAMRDFNEELAASFGGSRSQLPDLS